ncbi:hypothetical protein [Bacillus altitudinis]|uniref:ParB/Sulfiredoxin domain-containing protein n=1 Tax=Bacillus altitudinis TaxID=293387 RepID=A0ABV1S916_BACAB|nr:hypothetical protein [Bacillus altitudinis]NOL32988.1 hypothetical protein [Bacillus altitudinis]
MPAYFNNLKTTYYKFDFQSYLESPPIKSNIGRLSFYKSWVKYWCDIFIERDKDIEDYAKQKSNITPIFEMSQVRNKDVEFYSFDFKTSVGTYRYHYDVDILNEIVKQKSLVPEDVDLKDVYVDSTTTLLFNKIKDNRPPIIVYNPGVPVPLLCVDGNKRIMAQKKLNNIKSIKAVYMPFEFSEYFFFNSLDNAFYYAHLEIEMLARLLEMGQDEKTIYMTTALSRNSHNG